MCILHQHPDVAMTADGSATSGVVRPISKQRLMAS
jgi:hypothetical protein